MPLASNVYRKIEVGRGSTPSGSHLFFLNFAINIQTLWVYEM